MSAATRGHYGNAGEREGREAYLHAVRVPQHWGTVILCGGWGGVSLSTARGAQIALGPSPRAACPETQLLLRRSNLGQSWANQDGCFLLFLFELLKKDSMEDNAMTSTSWFSSLASGKLLRNIHAWKPPPEPLRLLVGSSF